MFGLFAASGGRRVEKRVLAYGSTSDEERTPGMFEGFMEVKVYRSESRKRVMPEVKEYQGPRTSRKSKKPEPSSSKERTPGHSDGIE